MRRKPPACERPTITFKSGVEVVTVTAAVSDRPGPVVRDLNRDDFRVPRHRQRREIRDFHAGEAPISLAIAARHQRQHGGGRQHGRARQAVASRRGHASRRGGTKQHSSPSMLRCRKSSTFTRDVDVIRRLSLEGQTVGHHVTVRCRCRDGQDGGREGEPAPGAAGDHRRHGHRQPHHAHPRFPASPARSTSRCTC